MRRVRDSRRGSFGGFESEACLRDRDRVVSCGVWVGGFCRFYKFPFWRVGFIGFGVCRWVLGCCDV